MIFNDDVINEGFFYYLGFPIKGVRIGKGCCLYCWFYQLLHANV